MAQDAYCQGCGRRVILTAEGACPNGHMRSMLRDVRDGIEPPSAQAAVMPRRPVSPSASSNSDNTELLAAVIGKAFIIVPIAAIIAFALWTGYEEAVGSGTSAGMAVLMSVGSLIVTVGGVFVWMAMSRRRKH